MGESDISIQVDGLQVELANLLEAEVKTLVLSRLLDDLWVLILALGFLTEPLGGWLLRRVAPLARVHDCEVWWSPVGWWWHGWVTMKVKKV